MLTRMIDREAMQTDARLYVIMRLVYLGDAIRNLVGSGLLQAFRSIFMAYMCIFEARDRTSCSVCVSAPFYCGSSKRDTLLPKCRCTND